MKNILIITLTLLFSISCKAQTKNLYEEEFHFEEGFYYKDIPNFMNKFEGTWVFENGTKKLTIVLQKREHVYSDVGNNYTDEIIGGYKYEVSGAVLVNTIPDIDTSKGLYENYIAGASIIRNFEQPACNDCPVNERRLRLNWDDPLSTYINNYMVVQHYELFDQEYIKVTLFDEMSIMPTEDAITTTRLPLGIYTLQKQ